LIGFLDGSGGGSGGSIWISAQTLAGNGSLNRHAAWANPLGGGGVGWTISIYAGTISLRETSLATVALRVSGTNERFYSFLLPYFRQRDESKWPRDSERIGWL